MTIAFEYYTTAVEKALYNYGVSYSVEIDHEGYVSVRNDVFLNSSTRLNNGVLPFAFKSVSGSLIVPRESLVSLIGLPENVGGILKIGKGYIKSLEGLPKKATEGLVIDCDFDPSRENIDIIEACETSTLILNKNMKRIINRIKTINIIINEEN